MKLTERVLITYLNLKEQEKFIKKEMELIREVLIETHGYESRNYIALVTERERLVLAPLKEFEKILGLDVMKKNGLYYVTHYKQLDVHEKPPKLYTVSK